ncbi:hypothetical protein IV203_012981 [Nitzschia inconspicua]|uniref:Uncharacterized protein n=1 Tax=Nitzschia inconspicua TaxID=303405 RepID=A0A9K3Q7P0_9STRA|nr:hypothetical protein IV203_012981 [Nitzschia inconspicua]
MQYRQPRQLWFRGRKHQARGWVSSTRHGTTKSSGPYAGGVYVGYAPYAFLIEKGEVTAKEIGPEGPLIRVENVYVSVNETIHAEISIGDTVDIFSTTVCGNMTDCALRTDWNNKSYNSRNDGIVPRISTVLLNGNIALVNSSYATDKSAPKRRSAHASVFVQDLEGRIVSLRIEAVDTGLPFGVTIQGFSYTNTEADAECNETASYDFCGQSNRLPDFAAIPTWALPCELVADIASTGTLELALNNTLSRCEHGRGLEPVERADYEVRSEPGGQFTIRIGSGPYVSSPPVKITAVLLRSEGGCEVYYGNASVTLNTQECYGISEGLELKIETTSFLEGQVNPDRLLICDDVYRRLRESLYLDANVTVDCTNHATPRLVYTAIDNPRAPRVESSHISIVVEDAVGRITVLPFTSDDFPYEYGLKPIIVLPMLTMTSSLCNESRPFEDCDPASIREIMLNEETWAWPCDFLVARDDTGSIDEAIMAVVRGCSRRRLQTPVLGCCSGNYKTRCGSCPKRRGLFDVIYTGSYSSGPGGAPILWTHYQNNVIDVQRHDLHTMPSVISTCTSAGGAPDTGSYFARPIYRVNKGTWDNINLRETTYVRWCSGVGISKPGLRPRQNTRVNVRQWMGVCASTGQFPTFFLEEGELPHLGSSVIFSNILSLKTEGNPLMLAPSGDSFVLGHKGYRRFG